MLSPNTASASAAEAVGQFSGASGALATTVQSASDTSIALNIIFAKGQPVESPHHPCAPNKTCTALSPHNSS